MTALSSPPCPSLLPLQEPPLSSPSSLAAVPLEALPLVQNPSTEAQALLMAGLSPPGFSLSGPQHLQGACCGREPRSCRVLSQRGQGLA